MNHTKSSILLLNSNERKNPIAKAIQFNVVDQFKYLGIHIVPRLEQVPCANYDPLMAEINESIDRWMSLPVSLMGRVKYFKNEYFAKAALFIPEHPVTTTYRFILKSQKIICWFSMEQPQGKTTLVFIVLTI